MRAPRCIAFGLLFVALVTQFAWAQDDAPKAEPAKQDQVKKEQPAPKKDQKPEKPPVKPEDLTIELVDAAIEKAIAALRGMRPAYVFLPHEIGWIRRDQNVRMGNQAVATWALLAAGQSYQMPDMHRRINFMLSQDQPRTFFRSMRAQMLGELPSRRFKPWLRRERMWLASAMTKPGGYQATWTGDQSPDPGDHANAQYGTWGLLACQESGEAVTGKVWETIDRHWRTTQDGETGAWAVQTVAKAEPNFYTRVSGPMTAGGVSVLGVTERFLYGPKLTDVGKANVSKHLRKGLGWLDTNFSLTDPNEEGDFYYYMWTVQRVGQISGYRTFNQIDWFRRVTAQLLTMQADDGSWNGPKGRVVSTAFGLLYLIEARSPLAFAKIRFDGTWQNRPHDLLNLTDHLGGVFEESLTWQIAELNQPVHELIESPILYLTTHERFELSDEQVQRLRQYIDAGGMLLLAPEGIGSGRITSSFTALARKLFGGKAEWTKVPSEHPLIRLHDQVSPRFRMYMIHNGVRPLVVRCHDDISKPLQLNNAAKYRDTFRALGNLYLYATGIDPRRARLQTEYVVRKAVKPKRKATVVRIQHRGNFDPEPGALSQLQAILANDHDVDMTVSTLRIGQLTDQKLAFFTTTGDANLNDQETAAMRQWLERGGTLWLDAAGGGQAARENAQALCQQILPDSPLRPLDASNPILTGAGLDVGYVNARVRYRRFAMQSMGLVTTARILGARIAGRPAIYFSGEDITCGLAGLNHWDIFGYTPDSARRLVINSVLAHFPPPAPKTQPAKPQPTAQPTPPSPPATAPPAKPAER